jgi:gamma-glutamyl hydrolase
MTALHSDYKNSIQIVVSEARKSNHHYPTQQEEDAALIYNYEPVYTEALDPSFEQCYFFNE